MVVSEPKRRNDLDAQARRRSRETFWARDARGEGDSLAGQLFDRPPHLQLSANQSCRSKLKSRQLGGERFERVRCALDHDEVGAGERSKRLSKRAQGNELARSECLRRKRHDVELTMKSTVLEARVEHDDLRPERPRVKRGRDTVGTDHHGERGASQREHRRLVTSLLRSRQQTSIASGDDASASLPTPSVSSCHDSRREIPCGQMLREMERKRRLPRAADLDPTHAHDLRPRYPFDSPQTQVECPVPCIDSGSEESRGGAAQRPHEREDSDLTAFGETFVLATSQPES